MNHYLSNYRFGGRLFESAPKTNTELIVVIPCYNEVSLIASLEALLACENKSEYSVEVIVVVNASETETDEIKELNQKTFNEATIWAKENSNDWINFLVYLNNDLPKKHAGVGLARKIGMDEAVDRFEQIDNQKGIIVCFDADSKCDSNYLVEIQKHFSVNPKANGASIQFEHPIEGDEFSREIYDGIVLYELFLRYYRQAFKYTEHPQAYHTVGSSMAVTTKAYQMQTGMNKRKAGEDFYFLQKIIQLGNFIEINTTRVIPSPRTSDRVPFGTGRALLEFIDGRDLKSAYSFQSFIEIKNFIEAIFREYREGGDFGDSFIENLSACMKSFLQDSDFRTRSQDLRQYGKNEVTFSKRFYNWFNAFRVLKFVHYSRDHFYPNGDLLNECMQVLASTSDSIDTTTEIEMLEKYRALDRIG
ncbi:MAG: glycosyltransferase [Salibacteraceae bacterium]